jgi:hypothetical protein
MLDALEQSASISPALGRVIETNVDSSACQRASRVGDNKHEAWEELVDRTLLEWGKDPSVLEDDGVVPPSMGTITRAYEIATFLRIRGFPAPTRIVPTGDGGVAFQFEADRDFDSLEVAEDGNIECLRFSGSKLVERYEVSIPAGVR